MAALLVSVGVMTLLMSVAMPVWRHEMQREKEAELVFRGEQYARAINLYQRKMGPGNFPPNVDILVQQRFLRKKYKDPITNGDFQLIAVGAGAPTVPGQQQQPGGGQRAGGAARGGGSTGFPQTPGGGRASGAQPPGGSLGGRMGGGQRGQLQFGQGGQPGLGQAGGGIMGVASKSKESSIRIYHGATHYNEWAFLFSNVSNRPGAQGGRGGAQNPGGQRGTGRGNRGNRGNLGIPGINPGTLGVPGGAPGTGPGGSSRGRGAQD
jgi:type II secretory pathway pseudopilin PulG